jgi:hypothetical protein
LTRFATAGRAGMLLAFLARHDAGFTSKEAT